MSRARDNANLSPTIADARMPNLTGDVTTSEGAVATTIATDAVDIAMLSATGIADATTFLRGDNSWATAGGTTFSSLTLTPGSSPGSPDEGELYYNSNTNVVMIYNGSEWEQINNNAIGGIVTSYADGGTTYRVHTFLTSGIFTGFSGNVDYLIVAGGGGGGGYGGAGGGAGGMIAKTNQVLTAGTKTVLVGAGGPYNAANQPGGQGGNSSFDGDIAYGGGFGSHNFGAGGDGGSGGGGLGNPQGTAATGVSGQGNAGGQGDTTPTIGRGGGGGAGGAGGNTTSTSSGLGGIAVTNDYRTGSAVYYAGGGGAGRDSRTAAGCVAGFGGGTTTTAEKGGGADGGNATGTLTHAEANTGGGGGGGYYESSTQGSAGGSGIVIIRYTI